MDSPKAGLTKHIRELLLTPSSLSLTLPLHSLPISPFFHLSFPLSGVYSLSPLLHSTFKIASYFPPSPPLISILITSSLSSCILFISLFCIIPFPFLISILHSLQPSFSFKRLFPSPTKNSSLIVGSLSSSHFPSFHPSTLFSVISSLFIHPFISFPPFHPLS